MTDEARVCATCETQLVRTLDLHGKAGRWPVYCPTCRPKAVARAKGGRQRMRRELERRTALDAIRDDIRAEEHAAVADILERAGALVDRLAELVGRLERPVAPVSHQRIADGGVGGRRERKERASA